MVSVLTEFEINLGVKHAELIFMQKKPGQDLYLMKLELYYQ